uniref:Uncharacterized protein n=1 Tax=Rhizophora mucronata TaxID=61149 RepID=A0A2P2Q4I6_RHIMU
MYQKAKYLNLVNFRNRVQDI